MGRTSNCLLSALAVAAVVLMLPHASTAQDRKSFARMHQPHWHITSPLGYPQQCQEQDPNIRVRVRPRSLDQDHKGLLKILFLLITISLQVLFK